MTDKKQKRRAEADLHHKIRQVLGKALLGLQDKWQSEGRDPDQVMPAVVEEVLSLAAMVARGCNDCSPQEFVKKAMRAAANEAADRHGDGDAWDELRRPLQ